MLHVFSTNRVNLVARIIKKERNTHVYVYQKKITDDRYHIRACRMKYDLFPFPSVVVRDLLFTSLPPILVSTSPRPRTRTELQASSSRRASRMPLLLRVPG